MSKSTPTLDTPDYANLIQLLAVYSEAAARNASLQVAINQELLDSIDGHKAEYAENQQAMAEAEGAITTLVERNPQWFLKRKTISTPYGEVKSTTGRKLEIPSVEASIRLIKEAGLGAAFLRQIEEIDKESLEKLTDIELANYGIYRKKTETVSIKPVEVDLGKAVQEAA